VGQVGYLLESNAAGSTKFVRHTADSSVSTGSVVGRN
jgi:hypothetical protein